MKNWAEHTMLIQDWLLRWVKKNSHNIQCYVTGASSELHKILFYWVVKMTFMKYDTGIAKIEIHDYLLAMLFSTLEKG